MQSNERRNNQQMAAIVERGIELQQLYGTKVAAAYLNSHSVNIEVTMRVLSRPWERRVTSIGKVIADMDKQLTASSIKSHR